MPERVDRVVLSQFRVPEDGSPEPDVDRVRLSRDGELNFLHRSTIGHRAVLPGHLRDLARQLDVLLLQPHHATG